MLKSLLIYVASITPKCCPCWLNAEVSKTSTEGVRNAPAEKLINCPACQLLQQEQREQGSAGVPESLYFSAPSYSLMRDRKVTGSKKF